jgi:hypothetical protein
VQQDEFDETELGVLLWLLREESDGTSESESDSSSDTSESSSSESSKCCAASLALNISADGFVSSAVILPVEFGFVGFGD